MTIFLKEIETGQAHYFSLKMGSPIYINVERSMGQAHSFSQKWAKPTPYELRNYPKMLLCLSSP